MSLLAIMSAVLKLADNTHQCIADLLSVPSSTSCHKTGCPFQHQIVHPSLARACTGASAILAGVMPQSLSAWSSLSTSSSLCAADRLILNLHVQMLCHHLLQSTVTPWRLPVTHRNAPRHCTSARMHVLEDDHARRSLQLSAACVNVAGLAVLWKHAVEELRCCKRSQDDT